MPKKVFRQQPPLDLLTRFLATCSLKNGQNDATWFTKSCISLSSFEELLAELEPYYLPCLTAEYIHKTPLTSARAITILRQILQEHSIQLHSMERSMAGVRGVWYQLRTPLLDPGFYCDGIQLDFT